MVLLLTGFTPAALLLLSGLLVRGLVLLVLAHREVPPLRSASNAKITGGSLIGCAERPVPRRSLMDDFVDLLGTGNCIMFPQVSAWLLAPVAAVNNRRIA